MLLMFHRVTESLHDSLSSPLLFNLQHVNFRVPLWADGNLLLFTFLSQSIKCAHITRPQNNNCTSCITCSKNPFLWKRYPIFTHHHTLTPIRRYCWVWRRKSRGGVGCNAVNSSRSSSRVAVRGCFHRCCCLAPLSPVVVCRCRLLHVGQSGMKEKHCGPLKGSLAHMVAAAHACKSQPHGGPG